MIPSPRRLSTGQTTQPQTIPAPIGGLNGRDPLANMDARDAYLMDNVFPGTSAVESRRGCTKYTGSPLAAPVQSLEVYTGAAGDKMLAWAGGVVYDVSTGVPSQKATGKLGNVVVSAMFSNAADNAQHLIITSGVDVPMRYDGNTLSDLALTGMTGVASTLAFVFAFKSRLYWAQRDKLGFYYLPVGQIQGELKYFDLGQVSRLGGYVVAIASFSESSNGQSPDDYIVFITSKGEMIVYAGYDPSNAATWALVGRYYAAAPIGRKCTINYGTELVVLTEEGALPFSQIRRAGDAKAQGVAGAQYSAITSKLGRFLSYYNTNKNVPGWQGVQYSGGGGWLLLNVPASGGIAGEYYHYVMNTTTNSWCRFTGWNGMCFAVFRGRLYFGRYDGHVMLADEGRFDDGAPIRFSCKPAYTNFDDGSGMGFLQKHFQWAAVLLSCDGTPALSGKFNVDYQDDTPEYLNALAPPGGAAWDTAQWDVGSWGDDLRTQRFIVTLNKGGTAGTLWLRGQLAGLTFQWYATQFTMQKTQGLLL